jgi:hypothetical protein
VTTPGQAPQLTFDVGGEKPSKAVLRFSGGLFLDRELAKGEELHVQVVDTDGQVVGNAYGRIVAVAFKDKVDEHGSVTETERVHFAKVS